MEHTRSLAAAMTNSDADMWQCRLCASNDVRVLESRVFNHLGRRRGSFLKCDDCGVAFRGVVDGTTDLYVDRDSPNFSSKKNRALNALKRWYLRIRASRYIGNQDGKRVLDYGCGGGELANALTGLDVEVLATDLARDRPETLSNEIEYRPIYRVERTHAAYDVVILRHVLEHVGDPTNCLNMIGGLVAPGGDVVIEVPNVSSVHRRFMRGRWPGYFYPYHEFVFSRDSIERLAHDCGYSVLRIRKCEPPIGGLFLTSLGIPRSIARILSALIFPLQWITSRVGGTSEGMEIHLRQRVPHADSKEGAE